MKIGQEFLKPKFSFIEIDIMTEFGPQVHFFDSWLLKIKLPRVNVEYERFLLFFVNGSQGPPDNEIREQPEVTAPGDWDILAEHFRGGEREFDYEF